VCNSWWQPGEAAEKAAAAAVSGEAAEKAAVVAATVAAVNVTTAAVRGA